LAMVLGNRGLILNFPQAFLTTASSEIIVFARKSGKSQISTILFWEAELLWQITQILLAKLTLNSVYTPSPTRLSFGLQIPSNFKPILSPILPRYRLPSPLLEET
jgi:hypothetical protein